MLHIALSKQVFNFANVIQEGHNIEEKEQEIHVGASGIIFVIELCLY